MKKRFDIYNEVWVMQNNAPTKFIVTKIQEKIGINNEVKETQIEYYLCKYSSNILKVEAKIIEADSVIYDESLIFRSKQDIVDDFVEKYSAITLFTGELEQVVPQ